MVAAGQSVTGARPQLTPATLYGAALHTLRARWRRVLPVAAAVGLVGAVLDVVVERVHDDPSGSRLVVLIVLAASASVFGTTFLAGVLDTTVGEHQYGIDAPQLRHLHRHLPWVSLIVADLLISVARGLLLLVAVAPALVVVSVTCITGPVIMSERVSATDGIRTSIRLVWPRFWLAFVAVTIPLSLETGLVLAIEELHPGRVGHLLLLVGVETPFSTLVALAEVSLAYSLIRASRERTTASA